MDISTLDLRAAVSAGAEVELRHPGTGAGIGVFLTVQGYDSADVESAERDVSRRAMKSTDREKAAEIMAGVHIARAQAALMSVRGGSGSTETAEQFRALMADPGWVWVVEQIKAFAGDRASFFASAEGN